MTALGPTDPEEIAAVPAGMRLAPALTADARRAGGLALRRSDGAGTTRSIQRRPSGRNRQ